MTIFMAQTPLALRLFMSREQNQPVRNNVAIARVSLQSVLLRNAESAALTKRDTMQTMPNPTAFNPLNKCLPHSRHQLRRGIL